MNWKLPNQLTVGRIVLAAVFFVLLGLYDAGSPSGPALLNVAFVLYIVAGVTDILDGWVARKFGWTSVFGRIVDPFVDKILVVGAFAMLAGLNYAADPGATPACAGELPDWLTGGMASAVQAWMVVAVVAREFVVSAVRGYSESRGVAFAATWAGKLKMFLQSVAICTVLYQLANVPQAPWAVYTKIATVWVAVVVTVLSGFIYVGRARNLLRSDA
ncbi:MAG: CDP-alcohol phosphatidyltransferase family protein [Phycisphaerae bacterium]|nr:CDP-alcohol phosphatidyltransferase family protein [Phycisphaerae bacterium]